MPRIDKPPSPPARTSRVERELERERKEHTMNHDAKAHLGVDEDERNKDARQTNLSDKVRR